MFAGHEPESGDELGSKNAASRYHSRLANFTDAFFGFHAEVDESTSKKAGRLLQQLIDARMKCLRLKRAALSPAASKGESEYYKHILRQSKGTHSSCMGCDRPDGFGAQYQCKMAAFAVASSLERPYFHIPLNRSKDRMRRLTDDAANHLETAMGLQNHSSLCSGDYQNLETSGIPDRDPSYYYSASVRDELRALYFGAFLLLARLVE